MIYEHPLAYLLGLEGIALMRAYTGEHDREFVEARLAEVRRLLDDDALATAAVDVTRVDSVDGYGIWSSTYDRPNSAFADEPVVAEIVDALPVGVALDAACGTGRHASLLADRGHRVLGVDSSPDMLAHARERVAQGEFRIGDLRALPVADGEVDLVVCALALTHVPALDPVLAEFARVLRPGGHMVITDMHPEAVARGSIPRVRLSDGRRARLECHRHGVGDYLRAALRAGLQVRSCVEPVIAIEQPATPASGPGPWDAWPYSLAPMVPEAARAVSAGVPGLLVWHFEACG